jgi:hypothetical protein
MALGRGSAGEQTLRVRGRNPVALFGDADGDDLELLAVDGLEHGCGGEQRDFVLAAAATEEDAYAEFFHL